MNYIYHINGEERKPTKEEWADIARVFFETAGYEVRKESDKQTTSVRTMPKRNSS